VYSLGMTPEDRITVRVAIGVAIGLAVLLGIGSPAPRCTGQLAHRKKQSQHRTHNVGLKKGVTMSRTLLVSRPGAKRKAEDVARASKRFQACATGRCHDSGSQTP